MVCTVKVGGKEEAHGGHLMWVITILPVWDCCPAVLLCVCISHTCCIGLVSGAGFLLCRVVLEPSVVCRQ